MVKKGDYMYWVLNLSIVMFIRMFYVYFLMIMNINMG